MAVTGTASTDLRLTVVNSLGFPSPVSVTQEIQQTDQYNVSGTGAGQVDVMYAKAITLSATPVEIDLTTLLDPTGTTVSFGRSREFVAQNPATTAGFDVAISAGLTNGVAWLPASGSGLKCRYGSVLRISDKLSTGAGNGNYVDATHKNVRFDPGANSLILEVAIGGCSTA